MDETNKKDLCFFQPGKREGAFYTKQKLRYTDRFGLQSENNDGFYIYEWDPDKDKHIRTFVRKDEL